MIVVLSGLRAGLALTIAVPALVMPVSGQASAAPAGARELSFHSLHTGEKLSARYWSNGRFRMPALRRLNHIMRDWRTGEVTRMDPDLLHLLHALRREVDSSEPFQIISAYRSPKTNAMLAARGGGVARKSLHMRGMAIDVRLADVPLSNLRRAARSLRRGGVGYYPRTGFLHLDTGRARNWG